MANSLTRRIETAIKVRLAAGDSVSEIAKKFKISNASVYLIRKQNTNPPKRTDTGLKNNDWTPTLEREMYVCINGHQFKSNLSLDRVMRPD